MSEARLQVNRLTATTPQGRAGDLVANKGYFFTYDAGAAPEAEISLLMPRRAEQYTSASLFPLFQMNLPEGYMLELLRNRFAKATRFDPMLLLALTGQESAIGRVALHAPGIAAEPEDPVSLATLLANEGAQDLFRDLAQRYLQRTGISGVQPKLLVPVTEEMYGKAAVTTSELIVKTAGDQYPGLPANEFICMSIAQKAGIPVPEFYLSDDGKRFVMRRFDRTAEGYSLGFEDMAVLMNLEPSQKYEGDYRRIARAITLFCPAENTQSSLTQFFDQVALSCMLGNGDAHLKNFGLVYSHPSADDARLSPAYDIVCTTCYIPEDAMALSLMGSKSFFQARADLVEFGERYCFVADAKERINSLVEAASAVLSQHEDLIETVPGLEDSIRQGMNIFEKTYGHDRRHRAI